MIINNLNRKKRLFELMNKVNKLHINENNTVDSNLSSGYDMLVSDGFRFNGNGECNIKSQKNDDGLFVEFNCKDENNNKYIFNFQVFGNADESDSSVFNLNDIKLVNFTFENPENGAENATDVEISNFNKINADSYFDTISKYIELDFDSDTENIN